MQNNDYFKMLQIETLYFENKFNKDFGDEISKSLITNTFTAFYSNKEYIEGLSTVKGISIDFILYSKLMKYKLMYVIAANHFFNLNDIEMTVVETSSSYIQFLAKQSYFSLLNEDFNSLEVTTLFLSNPAVSNILNVLHIINESVKKQKDEIISLEIKHILDSLYSMIILMNNKCFPQAMSVFRQALEQYITLALLVKNPNAISSFLSHQAITIKDATGNLTKEELARYIEENNLTYNTYKSYLNYGWLDQIEDFVKLKQIKPNTKYSIKTVATIADLMGFYDAMDFASNYVHSNFVFLDVNWDMVLKEVFDGVYQIVDWIISSYKNIVPGCLVVNGFDYERLYNFLKKRSLKIISDDLYVFNIK